MVRKKVHIMEKKTKKNPQKNQKTCDVSVLDLKNSAHVHL